MPAQPLHRGSPQNPPLRTHESLHGSFERNRLHAGGNETHEPNSRYQPSRGAQRDAKWHARVAERSHLVSRRSPMAGRVPPPHPGNWPQNYPPPNGFPNVGHHGVPLPPRTMEQVRAEQRAAIAVARRTYADSVQAAAVKEETDRKVRRIQLQVFVHAR